MEQSRDWGTRSAEIARQASSFPVRHFSAIVRLGLVPTLLAAVVTYAGFRLFGPALWQLMSGQVQLPSGTSIPLMIIAPMLRGFLPLILASLPFVIAGTVIAVGLQRMIVLGEQPGPGWVIFRFRKYERSYTVVFFLSVLVLIAELAAMFSLVLWAQPAPAAKNPSSPMGILIFAAMCALFYVHMRLVLVFPHAAITGRIVLKQSWTAMKGNVLPYLVTQWRFSFRIAPAFFVVAVIFMMAPPGLSAGLLLLGNLAVLGFLHVMHAALNGCFYKDVTGGLVGARTVEAHP